MALFDCNYYLHLFPSKKVMAQLNACGVVETIKISAAAYPIR